MELLPAVKTKIEQIAKECGSSYDEMKVKFDELYNSSVLSSLSNIKQRQTEAARALRGQTLRKRAAIAGAKACNVVVLDKTTARTFKSKKTQKYMTIATSVMMVSIDDKFLLAPVGFWNEDAPGINNVDVGAAYKTQLVIRKPKTGQLIGSANCSGFVHARWDKEDTVVLVDYVAKHIDKGHIKKLSISNMGNCIGHYGVIDATVLRYYSGVDDETGRRYANYTVADDEVTDEYIRETGGLTCWLNDPDMLQYGMDSHLYIFGMVSKSADGSVSFRADGIVPILSFPLTVEAEEEPDEDILKNDVFGDVDMGKKKNEFPDQNNKVSDKFTAKDVFGWIVDLCQDSDDESVRYRVVQSHVDKKGCDKFTLEERISTLLDLGNIYEPSIGTIKYTDDKWPDGYDDNGKRIDVDSSNDEEEEPITTNKEDDEPLDEFFN